MKVVKRIIEQKVIGYSSDLTRTHVEHVVEFVDGSRGTVWSTDVIGKTGLAFSGSMTDIRPVVDRAA